MVFFYLAIYVAAVLVILAAFFHNAPRLRVAAVLLGAVAIWLPFTMLHTSLGRPNPFRIEFGNCSENSTRDL